MNIKLIIADDHRVFIDGIQSLLKEMPDICVIATAENGNTLVEQVASYQPDIILTDIQMPLKNGIEATKEICLKFPQIKIIALTMFDESIYLKKMLAAGAKGYLLKTTNQEELCLAIKKVAAGEKYFSAGVINLMANAGENKTVLPKPLETLSKREKEVLILIAQGLTDKEIADAVFLSPLTVISHRKNILSKLGLKNKVEIARFAIENNLAN